MPDAANFIFDKAPQEGDRAIAVLAIGEPTPDGKERVTAEVYITDTYPYDYLYQSGEVIYSPQTMGPKEPLPDPRMFQGLIITDPSMTDLTKARLMQYFGSIGQNADNLPGLQAGWQILIAAYGDTWLTPEVKAIVEGHAAAANMPLTP